MAVTEAGEGMLRRDTSDEQVVRGDVLRTLVVKRENGVKVTPADVA